MTANTPSLSVYVINLARATERMRHMEAQLQQLELPFTRIEAVLGSALQEPIEGFDEQRFNILTGKHANKGEIGCFFSHIQTFKTFLETTSEYALVLEDDVNLPANLIALIQQAYRYSDTWDLLRLTSSREGSYLPIAALAPPFELGYNTRVLKNTGAYCINRRAAQLCLKHLMPMRLPYDVALDRDWDCGFRTACIYPFPVELAPFEGQINKAPRIRIYRATTFHLFHLLTRIQRKKMRQKYYREITATSTTS